MADKLLKTIAGGGGDFLATSFDGVKIVPSGASGTVISITPAAGKRIRLNSLIAFTQGVATLSIIAGGKTVVSERLLNNPTTPTEGDFSIGVYSNARIGAVSIPYIQGDYGESIEITTLTALTTDLFYNFTEGL